LLVMLSRVDPDAPLVVAANRDERLERPARAMTVLSEGPPRILGGHDALAGGTWLAVNEHGVVAGLTNRPLEGGRDPNKRSRGELPLWLARYPNAADAVAAFVTTFSPEDFNPCWLLVGDRTSLFSVDMTAGPAPHAEALPPGSYVLENSALWSPTPKHEHVHEQVAKAAIERGDDMLYALREMLRDHTIPESGDPGIAESGDPGAPDSGASDSGASDPATQSPGTAASGATTTPRPRQITANCVHLDGYGTRSSLICSVPAAPRPIRLFVAHGPPCQAPMIEATRLWRS
jgi:uncharacterized protein with NRDE domain